MFAAYFKHSTDFLFEILKESLKENKTGRHYYICRTLLYSKLF